MIAGSTLGIAGLFIPKIWSEHHHGAEFPINGQVLFLIAIILSVGAYTLVSILTGGLKRPFNLEKMLHRGPYSVDVHEHEIKAKSVPKWQAALGITKRNFHAATKCLRLPWALGTSAGS